MDSHDIFKSPSYNLVASLIRAQRVVDKYAEKSANKLGDQMPLEQRYIYDVLKVFEACTISDLTRLLIREPSSVLQILKRMEKKGTIYSTKLPGTRKLSYKITKTEDEILTEGLESSRGNVFSGLTENEQNDLKRLLDKLFNSVMERLAKEHSPFT